MCRWKANTEFPTLRILMHSLLAIPASSAGAEMTFSTAGQLLSEMRTCLKPRKVNMILVLYKNQTLW